MKTLLALIVLLATTLVLMLWGNFLTVDQLRDHAKYLAQLILGWTAWVCFFALVYAGIKDPRRIRGNNWFAVAGVLLTGGAFIWWATYFSLVPGAGGETLPCMVLSPGVIDWLNSSGLASNPLTSWFVPEQRCNVAGKVAEFYNLLGLQLSVPAYSPMMMWAGIICIAAWVVLVRLSADRTEPESQPQVTAPPQQ